MPPLDPLPADRALLAGPSRVISPGDDAADIAVLDRLIAAGSHTTADGDTIIEARADCEQYQADYLVRLGWLENVSYGVYRVKDRD